MQTLAENGGDASLPRFLRPNVILVTYRDLCVSSSALVLLTLYYFVVWVTAVEGRRLSWFGQGNKINAGIPDRGRMVRPAALQGQAPGHRGIVCDGACKRGVINFGALKRNWRYSIIMCLRGRRKLNYVTRSIWNSEPPPSCLKVLR